MKRSDTEIFENQFPYYLSVGMTEGQYWDGDCALAKYYRKAEQLRQERFNQQAWLQGMYVYDAVARLTPIMQAFAKKGTRAEPYPAEPYPITKQAMEQAKAEKERKTAQEGLRYMQALMLQNNRKFQEKE